MTHCMQWNLYEQAVSNVSSHIYSTVHQTSDEKFLNRCLWSCRLSCKFFLSDCAFCFLATPVLAHSSLGMIFLLYKWKQFCINIFIVIEMGSGCPILWATRLTYETFDNKTKKSKVKCKSKVKIYKIKKICKDPNRVYRCISLGKVHNNKKRSIKFIEKSDKSTL